MHKPTSLNLTTNPQTRDNSNLSTHARPQNPKTEAGQLKSSSCPQPHKGYKPITPNTIPQPYKSHSPKPYPRPCTLAHAPTRHHVQVLQPRD